MKDLYEALGVDKNATAREIKTAFRKLAIKAHPDREGGNEEKMKFLNEAYEVLSDPKKKREFDKKWQDYKVLDDEADVQIEGYFEDTDSVRFSESYKVQYDELYMKNLSQLSDVKLFIYSNKTEKAEPELYSIKIFNDDIEYYDNIFSYLIAKTKFYGKCAKPDLSHKISPEVAVQLFCRFLNGEFFGSSIEDIVEYLSSALQAIEKLNYTPSEKILYEGMLEIIQMVFHPHEHNSLIYHLDKITAYALETSSLILAKISPLFYNHYFRRLCFYALDKYCSHDNSFFKTSNFNFNGYEDAAKLLDVLKDRLSQSDEHNESLSKLIRYVKLLKSLDKQAGLQINNEDKAKELRKAAFDLLDWFPILMNNSSREILTNTLIQVGVKLQTASKYEADKAKQITDEDLAIALYLNAYKLTKDSLPDFEIYIYSMIVRCLTNMKYQHENLDEIINLIKRQLKAKCDIFPLLLTTKSNIFFFRQGEHREVLLRTLMQTMLDIYNHNKKSSKAIDISHSPSTILYYAYEACLKNWLMENHDPEKEDEIRVELMDQLLFDNGWIHFDVEINIDAGWVMVDRNNEGWLTPTRMLPYNDNRSFHADISYW